MVDNNNNISSAFGGSASPYYGVGHISAVLANKYGLNITPTGEVIFRNEHGAAVVGSNVDVSNGVLNNIHDAATLPKKPAYFSDLADPESSTRINNAYAAQEELNDYKFKNPTTTAYNLTSTFALNATATTADQTFTITPSQDIG